jgi:hypothetical protein
MNAASFTPPENGIVPFCSDGQVWYGIYLGIVGDNLQLFAPGRGGCIEINIEDTYCGCPPVESDNRLLARLGRQWCDGVLVEFLGQRLRVTDIVRRHPPVDNDILVCCDGDQEIVITDPRLKFVGHIDLST